MMTMPIAMTLAVLHKQINDIILSLAHANQLPLPRL